MYAKNASKLHKAVGEVLFFESPWKAFKVEQEVLVKDLFPDFGSSRERYDWVIHDLSVIIECHGKQHYEVATFGAEASDAIMNFQEQKQRDAVKKEAALLNGWSYIEIPYTDEKEINSDYLYEAYKTNKSSEESPTKTPPKKTKVQKESEEQKQQRRQRWRESYQHAKALRKKSNENR